MSGKKRYYDPHRRKRGVENYAFIFPNLFTTGNIFCGFYSIIASINGKFVLASYLIFAAALFDLVDGRVARLVKGDSDFGKEYDSLADLVSFGVAPVILAYLWSLSSIPRIGWLAPFLFVACGALRLARYNLTSKKDDPGFFTGLPIPMAAAAVSSFVLLAVELDIVTERNYYLLFMVLILSFLMVSGVKYKSYKKPQEVIKREFFTNMVLFVLLLIIVAIRPSFMLFFVIILYVLQGVIFSVFAFIRRQFRAKHAGHNGVILDNEQK